MQVLLSAQSFKTRLFILSLRALLLFLAVFATPARVARTPCRHSGIVLFAFSSLIPIECILGASAANAMLSGWSPAMTAFGYLGLALQMSGKRLLLLLTAPFLWCTFEIPMYLNMR